LIDSTAMSGADHSSWKIDDLSIREISRKRVVSGCVTCPRFGMDMQNYAHTWPLRAVAKAPLPPKLVKIAPIGMLHSMESDERGTADMQRAETANRRWRLGPLEIALVLQLALLVLGVALLARRTDSGEPKGRAATGAYVELPPPAELAVSLGVDFGNGVKREFTGVAWADGMTVGKLMEAAARMTPPLEYKVRGSGKMTFLTSLDGVANGEGVGRYWLYEVNGQLADVSFAVKPLASGDRVLWIFKEAE
jgi:hypothetical protein